MSAVVELSDLQALAEAGRETRPQAGALAADNVVPLWNLCTHAEQVTEYDLRNVYLYGHLLEAEREGASERHMAETVFRLRVDRHPVWALEVVRTHLARAHWMKQNVHPLIDW